MCDGGAISGPTAMAIASAVVAGAGTAVAYKGSRDSQDAAAQAKLAETARQGKVMQSNMALQQQQQQDSINSRDKFQTETLPAFTRESVDQDQATEQTRLQAALASAGQRATPTTGDAASANNSVSVGGEAPAAPSQNSGAYHAALGDQLGYAQQFGDQQTRAQAAMAALGRAQQLGGERLQTAGQSITLANAKNSALTRAINANGLLSNASTGLYQSKAEKAANKGAGMALLGSSLSTLGNAGYSYASKP
jgi:hypothetical protein